MYYKKENLRKCTPYPYLQGAIINIITIIMLFSINVTQARGDIHNQEDTHIYDSSVELMTWGTETVVHRGRKDIYLSEYSPQNSVVVLIVNDVPWTEENLRNLSGQFTVHAPSGQGLLAVVQVLNLRSGNSNSDSCIDFLQFYDPKSGVGTMKICGKVNKEDKSYLPAGIIGPRVFQSPSGNMKVQYKSDKGDAAFPKGDDISFHVVEIVFTAYRDCDSIHDWMALNRCGDKCISSMLFCDERINCGMEEDFALDEISCEPHHDDQYASSTKFTINIALFFLLLLIAGAFLILFYYHQDAYKRIQNIPHK